MALSQETDDAAILVKLELVDGVEDRVGRSLGDAVLHEPAPRRLVAPAGQPRAVMAHAGGNHSSTVQERANPLPAREEGLLVGVGHDEQPASPDVEAAELVDGQHLRRGAQLPCSCGQGGPPRLDEDDREGH